MTVAELEKISEDTRLFYRVPKKFFDDPEFSKLSTDAKVLYMILLDRRCLSKMNGREWRDEQGCVFIFFTVEAMMSLLNCGNKKVNELLKELENYNLVQRQRRGLGRPNRIYVNDILAQYNPNWKPEAKLSGEGDEKYA